MNSSSNNIQNKKMNKFLGRENKFEFSILKINKFYGKQKSNTQKPFFFWWKRERNSKKSLLEKRRSYLSTLQSRKSSLFQSLNFFWIKCCLCNCGVLTMYGFLRVVPFQTIQKKKNRGNVFSCCVCFWKDLRNYGKKRT